MRTFDQSDFEPISYPESGTELGSQNGAETEPIRNELGISNPLTYSELGQKYDISGDAVRKQIAKILELHPTPQRLTSKRGRQVVVTPEGQAELARFRELGVTGYVQSLEAIKRVSESKSLAVIPSVALEVYQPVAIDQFELPTTQITPRDLAKMLAIRASQNAIDSSQNAIETSQKNIDLLKETLRMVEEQNAQARGYANAAKLTELEKAGEAAFIQEQLKARLGGLL